MKILSARQLRETIRAEARRVLAEDSEGGSMRLSDALLQVKESSEAALQKATVIARALDRADSPAAQKILRELKNCVAGLQHATESADRAIARSSSVG